MAKDSKKESAIAYMVQRMKAEPDLSTADLCRDVTDRFECSERAYYNWRKAASAIVLEMESQIDLKSLEATRLDRARRYQATARGFDRYGDDQRTANEHASAVKYYTLSLRYHQQTDKILHIDNIPPDGRLDDEDVRMALVAELRRSADKFTTRQLHDMIAAFGAELEARKLAGEDEASEQERLAMDLSEADDDLLPEQ